MNQQERSNLVEVKLYSVKGTVWPIVELYRLNRNRAGRLRALCLAVRGRLLAQSPKGSLQVLDNFGVTYTGATIFAGAKDEYETKPLPPVEWEREGPSFWHWLSGVLSWLDWFLHHAMSELLLTITTLGALGAILGFGFGSGILAGISLLVGSLAATCWILLRLGGVFDDEWESLS